MTPTCFDLSSSSQTVTEHDKAYIKALLTHSMEQNPLENLNGFQLVKKFRVFYECYEEYLKCWK